MNSRRHHPLIAWMLYCTVLLSSLQCSIGHGQMVGLWLNGLGSQFCAVTPYGMPHDQALPSDELLPSSDSCVVTSLFSAILLAAFFCLLGLLAVANVRNMRSQPVQSPRFRWPLANPRAPPFVA